MTDQAARAAPSMRANTIRLAAQGAKSAAPARGAQGAARGEAAGGGGRVFSAPRRRFRAAFRWYSGGGRQGDPQLERVGSRGFRGQVMRGVEGNVCGAGRDELRRRYQDRQSDQG